MSVQSIQQVDIEAIEIVVHDPATPQGSIEQLFKMGTALYTESLQRAAEVDRKLTAFLGWSIAAAASLMFQSAKAGINLPAQIVASAGALSAIISIVLAAIALKTRAWPAPSVHDWFAQDLLLDASRLQRHHVISLLFSRQAHVSATMLKAKYFWAIELLLVFSAGSIVILIFL